MDMRESIQKHDSMLCIIPDDWYQKIVVNMLKQLQEKKVCYVTLNKKFKELLEFFEKNQIYKENFDFLEGMIFLKEKDPDDEFMDFLSSAYDMSSLLGACSKMVEVNKSEIILIDSLSTLIVQNETKEIIEFVSSVIDGASKFNCKTIFIVLRSDAKISLVEQMELVVDKIIDMG